MSSHGCQVEYVFDVIRFWPIRVAYFVENNRVTLGGGGNSTYYVTGTCHFARRIGTHSSVTSGGF